MGKYPIVHCIGDIYFQSFYNYNKAEPLYEKALAIKEKQARTLVDFYLLFKLYSELAAVNRAQLELDKALVYGLKYISYVDTARYPIYSVQSYTVTAEIYRDMGQFDAAKRIYEKAIELNLKSGGNNYMNLALHYIGLAETLQKEGSIPSAVSFYKKAIQLYLSNKGPKDINFINCLERLGSLYLDDGKFEEASKVLNTALALLDEYGLANSGQASGLHKLLGTYYEKINRPDSALRQYQYALMASSTKFHSLNYADNPSFSTVELKDYSYDVLLRKAELLSNLYVKSENITYAQNSFKTLILAEELLTRSRADLDRDDSKWRFFDLNYGVYDQLISVLDKTRANISVDSLHKTVVKYMERSKSKMLAEALNQANFSDPMLASDSLISTLNSYKQSLHYLQDQLRKIGSEQTRESNAMQNAIIDIDRKIRSTEIEINRKYPSYLQIKYNDNTPQLSQLTELAKLKDACVIEYFWGVRNIYAIGISKNKTIFKCLGPTDSLKKIIIPLNDFFKKQKYSFDEAVVSEFNHRSNFLYRTLLLPFEQVLNGSERIIIIPDGLIGQIPFEALTTSTVPSKANFKKLDYLVKSFVVSYSFSSSYLLNEKEKAINNPTILAFGFTSDSALKSYGQSNNGLAQLTGTRRELQSLSVKFPDGKFLYGEDVTELQFKAKASEYDIIHLAVHGQGNTDMNYSASLFFSDKDDNEDGELHWYEVFGMHLKARLAVISSCESGIGKTYRGEGMLSMASAFAYAGCPNIVMGLWKVDDHISTELMDSFYDQLLAHHSIDQSLAFSKRNYLDNADELSAHPRLWASLVAYGNQEIVQSNNEKLSL